MSKKENEQLSFDGMLGEEEEKTSLVPVEDEEDALVPVSAYSARPEFDPDDITPPMLRLMQGLSPEVQEGDAKPGQWVLTGFEPKDSIIAVPIAYAKRREYRDPDTDTISCRSFDGETGEGDPGGICADCPMNKWTGEGKKRQGPKCVFMYSYMMYAHDFDAGCILNFKRTGLAAGKSLNSLVSRRGFGDVVVKITSKLQTGGKGSYYIPQLAPISGEIAEEARLKAASYLGS